MENEIQRIETQTIDRMQQAREITIKDNTGYETATTFLKGLKGLQKQINETFDENIKKAYELHRGLIAKKNNHSKPVVHAEAIVKNKISEYLIACERVRREEQRKLEAEKLKKELAEKKKREEEAAKRAESLEAAGEHEEAEEVIQDAVEERIDTTPIITAPIPPKVEGISQRKKWDFAIVNIDKIDRTYMVPDMAKIRSQVRATEKNAERIVGGIKVFARVSIAARG